MEKPRKLRLETDELRVETFATDEAARTRGTVHGHDPYDTATGDFAGCVCDTRYNTCWGGCGPSQPATCPGRPGCGTENETQYLTCMQSCGWEGGQAVDNPFC
jgi:hypothetical protein